jgi:hypothetical protein
VQALELDDVTVPQKPRQCLGDERLEARGELGVIFQQDGLGCLRTHHALQGGEMGEHRTALARCQRTTLHHGHVGSRHTGTHQPPVAPRIDAAHASEGEPQRREC